MLRERRALVGVVALGLAGLLFDSANAASHLWRINEMFSNADGTVQFIELKECCGGSAEHGLFGKSVTSQTTGRVLNFPANLTGDTSGKHLLIGTAAFAALPGAPAPDYIVPNKQCVGGSNPGVSCPLGTECTGGGNCRTFFSIVADTIRYAPAQSYDTFTYGAGSIPTDGINSLKMTNFATHTFTNTTPNTPTNYNDDTGSVDAAGCVDTDGDGYGNPGHASCPNGAAQDCNDGNNAVHPGATELCTDGLDNDCNGNTDCDDTACAAVIPCVPTVSEFGVLVMGLLVLTGGSVVLLRRRSIVRGA